MGFGDNLQIKEALSSCENDIDSAITYLVNVFLDLLILILQKLARQYHIFHRYIYCFLKIFCFIIDIFLSIFFINRIPFLFILQQNFPSSSKLHLLLSPNKSESFTAIDNNFPVEDLRKLEESLYVEKWNIPCLRSQPLGLCLSSAIRLMNCGGLLVYNEIEALQRFMIKCLNDCLNKVKRCQNNFA